MPTTSGRAFFKMHFLLRCHISMQPDPLELRWGVDFEKTDIPERYDAGRGYSHDLMDFWLERVAEGAGGNQFESILDIGCGTGRFTSHLARYFSAKVIGIDPSKKMLAEAISKGGANTEYRQADASRIPVDDEAIDLAFLSMVFHHIENKSIAIQEFMRVLRFGGRTILRGCSTEQITHFPYVKFFPSTVGIMWGMLDPIAVTISRFEAESFKFASHTLVMSPVAKNWIEYYEKISNRSDSILEQISDDEFDDGLEMLRDHARDSGGRGPVIEPIDLLVFEKS